MDISPELLRPFIPVKGVSDLIKRKLNHPKKNQWELAGYELSEEIKEPNFTLLYRLLPDNYVADISSELFKGENPNKFNKALESNKNAWLHSIIEKFQPPAIQPIILPSGYKKTKLTATTAQPLIVGLGEPSPYETGITLDFLTGLPIIPGSAVKGITRRAAILKLAWKNRCQFGKEFKEKFGFELQSIENAEYADLFPYGDEFDFVAQKIENELRPNKFVEVFGTQELKGQVIFMDAYPIRWSKGLFRVDVMNPHYGPYYESKGGQPPADWYNPVPVVYLTVNTGVEYRFVLASKDEELLPKAVEWLKFALENIGVGAKGSQGYGVLEKIREINDDQSTY